MDSKKVSEDEWRRKRLTASKVRATEEEKVHSGSQKRGGEGEEQDGPIG